MRTGIVTGREFKKNRDGVNVRLMLQVQVTDSDDIQTVEYMAFPGEDSNPPDGSKVLIADVGLAYKIAIAADDNVEPSMLEGEKKLYSIDAGAISAFINLLQGGIIELNGNSDFAVRFNALKTAFDELRADFNSFITIFNTHLHGGVTAGGANTAIPTALGTSSAADMSGAKIDEIKVP